MTTNNCYLFLTFLVVAISGNPAMNILGKETAYIVALIIFMTLIYFKPIRLMRQDVLPFIYFTFLILIHTLGFGSVVVQASLGFLIKLSIALLAVRLIPGFSRRYVIVMYALSIISFVFFVPFYFGADMQSLFSSLRLPMDGNQYHIGIHNFMIESDVSIRNMGMFWEPGAFAGYLILALFFLAREGKNKAVLSKYGLVLIAALLSTQSTTGYLALIMLAMFYAYNARLFKGIAMKLLVLPAFIIVIIGGTYVITNEVSFLGKKIITQIESTSNNDDASRINRFGNFLYDLDWIATRPVLGWSANPATRFSGDPEVAELIAAQGNGLTGFAVKFGLVGLFVFIGFFAYATHQITGSISLSLLGIILICILLNGEQFLNFPMFLSLMFLPQRK